MAYFPEVAPGEKFSPSAKLSNNVRRLLNNQIGMFRAGALGAAPSAVSYVTVWNTTSSAFPAGSAVAFSEEKDQTMTGEAIPAVAVSDANKPWGICMEAIPADGIGSVIVAGPAEIKLKGDSGRNARPGKDGTFVRSNRKGAPVLFAGKESAVILLGGLSGGSSDDYEGDFLIVDVSETSESGHVTPRILVVNGSDYDSTNETSSPSICRTTNETHEVEVWDSGALKKKDVYVVLQYRHTGSKEDVKIRLMEHLLRNRGTLNFIEIGKLTFGEEGALSIRQTHQSGAVSISSGIATGRFGITAFFEEPDENDEDEDVQPGAVRINEGSVLIGSSVKTIEEESGSGEGVAYINVKATVSDGGDSVSYDAELFYDSELPEIDEEDDRWICEVGRVSKTGSVSQMCGGDISVSGRWV